MLQPAHVPSPRLMLAGAQPLAIGKLRYVFRHPQHEELLIKVVRPDAAERRMGPQAPWYKRRARARQYVVYVRELKEYIAAHAHADGEEPPIARVIGLVETDLGLGLVCEAVRGDDGALAPTLAELYERNGGFAPWIDRALDAFVEGLLACNVIVGDMHAWNLVYGTDSRGGPRFVMIDGFGEKHVIPRSSMSRRLNAWNTRKLYRRMRERLVALVPLDRGA